MSVTCCFSLSLWGNVVSLKKIFTSKNSCISAVVLDRKMEIFVYMYMHKLVLITAVKECLKSSSI